MNKVEMKCGLISARLVMVSQTGMKSEGHSHPKIYHLVSENYQEDEATCSKPPTLELRPLIQQIGIAGRYQTLPVTVLD